VCAGKLQNERSHFRHRSGEASVREPLYLEYWRRIKEVVDMKTICWRRGVRNDVENRRRKNEEEKFGRKEKKKETEERSRRRRVEV